MFVCQLQREAILFVSGTPLLNHVRDIQGYLRIKWRKEWSFDYAQGGFGEDAPEAFYDPDN